MNKLDIRDLLEVRESLETQELKERIDRILRMFEDEKAFDVTSHGKIIAHVVPVSETKQPVKQDHTAFWARIDKLATEIGAHISDTSVDAVEIVRDVRREL